MPLKRPTRLCRRGRLSRLGIRTQNGEDPEAGFAHRQLVELGVEAADLFGAAVVAALDLRAADRQRLARRPRSGERRGGEEGRSWWAADHLKKKKKKYNARGFLYRISRYNKLDIHLMDKHLIVRKIII